MDNLLQDDKELQDEELYALLDKALESDRLCVSEELIQKTLRRVEEESSSNVVSLDQKRKKRYSFMKYACVAAAAMLVLFVGVRTFGGKEFAMKDAQSEATADGMYNNSGSGFLQDNAVYPAESEGNEAIVWENNADDGSVRGEVSNSKSERNSYPDAVADMSEEAHDALTGSRMNVSAPLVAALTETGFKIVASEADYWEFVQREDYWEEELLRTLAACAYNKGYPEDGGYSYKLAGKNGSMYTVISNEPLDAIVGMETEGGMLWILFGQNVSLYEE